MTAKDKFLELFDKYIKREGSAELRQWLIESDFFIAPASTRFHGSKEGGLVEHSVNVWQHMIKLNKAYPGIHMDGETVTIIALLHDICKVNTYKVQMRNTKNENDQWVKAPYYTYEEDFPYGNHGGKSVFLLSKFIKLTDEEAVAIQCHMGNEDGKYTTSEAYRKFPLAWLLHVADEASSYLDNL